MESQPLPPRSDATDGADPSEDPLPFVTRRRRQEALLRLAQLLSAPLMVPAPLLPEAMEHVAADRAARYRLYDWHGEAMWCPECGHNAHWRPIIGGRGRALPGFRCDYGATDEDTALIPTAIVPLARVGARRRQRDSA